MRTSPAATDRAITELAGAQLELISSAQLAALGVRGEGIGRRMGHGWLTRVVRGVYVVGAEPVLTDAMLDLAGILWAGRGAAVVEGAAAAARGILERKPGRTSIGRRGHRRRLMVRTELPTVHGGSGLISVCGATFRPGEVGTVGACAVAEIPRILVDLAARSSDRAFLEAWRGAESKRQLDLDAVRRQLDDGWRPGHPRLRAHLESFTELDTGAGAVRSPLELEAIRLVLAAGAPMPLVNHRVDTPRGAKPFRLLDLYFELAGLCVETDGWETHGTRSQWEDDRVRDADLLELGILTTRYTRKRLREDPRRSAELILGLIERRT